MLLTVSKRLEFSASRRLFVKEWGEAENLACWTRDFGALRDWTELRRLLCFSAQSIRRPEC